MKAPRVYHSLSGWVIETTVGLSGPQLEAAVTWARREFVRQTGRLPRGERRQSVLDALSSLRAETIRQILVNPYSGLATGDRFPFAPDLIGG